MVKIKSVKVNFIMNMILTASTFIFPLITLPYITRVLSVEGVGKVNVATSIAQYFSMVAMLGVPHLLWLIFVCFHSLESQLMVFVHVHR